MIHQLKQASIYFEDVISGKKPFEVRKNDRNFKVGDFLGLNELNPDGIETGRSTLFRVNYILDNPEYCKEGYVVLGIQPCNVSTFGEPQILDEKDPVEATLEKIKQIGVQIGDAIPKIPKILTNKK